MKKLFLLLTLSGCSLFASAATPATTTSETEGLKRAIRMVTNPIITPEESKPISGMYALGKTLASGINCAGLLTAGCWHFNKTLSLGGLSHKESIAAFALTYGVYRGIGRYLRDRKKPDLLQGFGDNVNSLALGTLGLSFSKIS